MLKRSLLALCFGLMLPVVSLADSEGPSYDYSMKSGDQKYIFVMLRGCNHGEDVHFYPSDKYPESGLYLNDGSATPLWTVEWCGWVLLPSDGIHVVRRGPWARTYDEGSTAEAITFFAEGKLLKSYRVCDLVTIPFLHSRESRELKAKRYGAWAEYGLLIQFTETDWLLIGSQRPEEFLEAIRMRTSKPSSD